MLGRTNGYCVEFGAWDGRHLSNTAKLIDEGWAGCLIEGDPAKFEDLQRSYAGNDRLSLINCFVEVAGERCLDAILRQANAPGTFDLLSIDIDGLDYHMWAALEEHTPCLVVIEFNPTVPAHVVYVQENDPTINRGSSLAALAELGTQKGYALVAATDWNAFFLKADYASAHGLPAYTPAEVKNTQQEATIFHGFDGTLLVAGHRELIWHGIPYDVDQLQILPPDLRRIPVAQSQEYFEHLQLFKYAK